VGAQTVDCFQYLPKRVWAVRALKMSLRENQEPSVPPCWEARFGFDQLPLAGALAIATCANEVRGDLDGCRDELAPSTPGRSIAAAATGGRREPRFATVVTEDGVVLE